MQGFRLLHPRHRAILGACSCSFGKRPRYPALCLGRSAGAAQCLLSEVRDGNAAPWKGPWKAIVPGGLPRVLGANRWRSRRAGASSTESLSHGEPQLMPSTAYPALFREASQRLRRALCPSGAFHHQGSLRLPWSREHFSPDTSQKSTTSLPTRHQAPSGPSAMNLARREISVVKPTPPTGLLQQAS